MADLKTMLDNNMSITDINNNVNQFIGSANGHADKLKLTFVALHLLQEGSKLLCSVDTAAFISELRCEINNIETQTADLSKEYNAHLAQDDEIYALIMDGNDNQILNIQKQIHELLSKYDDKIRRLVEVRDELPIEKQLEQEKK